MLELLRNNYATYVDTAKNKPENHTFRLCLTAILSLAYAFFCRDNISDAYTMMATGITVLTGFTFSALFSDHALASAGLPKPKNETDKIDIVRLEVLSCNFQARTSYFIALSIVEVVILSAASFDFSISGIVKSPALGIDFLNNSEITKILGFAHRAHSFLSIATGFIINFIFIECLYTFYRMAETILAILERRRAYIRAHDDVD